MADYRRRATIEAPGRLVLNDLPFRPGQQVEVLVRSEEDRAARCRELAVLLKNVQSLPSAAAVTEEEILKEIAAHRGGR